MNKENEENSVFWQWSIAHMVLAGFMLVLLIWSFNSGLQQMALRWETSEEYGYGYMIPMIVAFFIWQKKNEIAEMEFRESWLGVFIVLLGGLLLVLGELATLFIVTQYAFLVSLFGMVLAITGWQVFKLLLPALFLLLFMIPLPNFLYQGLSGELQLISSVLGVEVIRLFGISVYLEGNVIDLGAYKLQVVEACSGLRYLFPLAALSYMAAYMFKGAFWKKLIIFVSSAPITVLMNSFRIGVIGVLVEHWGTSMAEGFLHDFEGWIVFMACMAVLVTEMWILSKIGKSKLAFADVFELTLPDALKGEGKSRAIGLQFKAAAIVALLLAYVPIAIEDREEIAPSRNVFATFPLELSGWVANREVLEQQVIDTLKFDDHFIANYVKSPAEVINLYVAYYESQRKGASIHSPKSCIPGGGWQIKNHEIKDIALADGGQLSVNRLIIQKGSARQLVYYWFDQRGRNMTNEYAIKWYLFWDALTRNRTDGALVRLTTFVQPDADMDDAEQMLEQFINEISGELKDYIPG